MTVVALVLALSLQSSAAADAAQAADSLADRAAVAEAAMADVEWSNDNAVVAGLVADLSGQGDDRAGVVVATLQDRAAACRQARFIQGKADEAASGMAEADPAFDALALIHMWAGFTVRRSCGEPVGDPAA